MYFVHINNSILSIRLWSQRVEVDDWSAQSLCYHENPTILDLLPHCTYHNFHITSQISLIVVSHNVLRAPLLNDTNFPCIQWCPTQ